MKRYLVFSYESYYPSGGWGDLHAQTDSLDEARTAAREQARKGMYVDLIDTHVGEGEEIDWREPKQ